MSILIKCNKCLKQKLLNEFITKTEKYKKKYYKKNICQTCFTTSEKDICKNKNLNYRIKKLLAKKIRHFTDKIDTTMNYIGCNIQYVREWIEYNFTEDMNWNNYETFWTIENIIPICNFDLTLEDNKYKYWNWSNLIPVPLLKSKQNTNPFLAPPFQKVDRLEKFKEEGSTTKWFSKEFVLNKDLAEIKAT